MINESSGTPNIINDIIIGNINEINISILSKKDLILVIDEYDLKCEVVIKFNIGSNYSGTLNFLECIKSNFKKCEINLYYPKNESKLIIKSMCHELTHLFELYQIKDSYEYGKWKRSEGLHNTRNQDVNLQMKYFRDIFYLSLPHEINARVSSLYLYLSSDKSNIEDRLKKTIEYLNYKNLIDFDNDSLYKDLIKKFIDDKELLYFMFNHFNKNMGIKTLINSDIDLFNYLKNSKRYFTDVAKKYKKRIYRVVNRILNEDNRYTTKGPIIVDYKDYIKENYRERNLDILLNTIDYLSYF